MREKDITKKETSNSKYSSELYLSKMGETVHDAAGSLSSEVLFDIAAFL